LGVHGRSSNMAIRCELGAFPVVLRCYKLMFNYFLRLSESGGLMDGIHNILKAAFAEDQLLLKKKILGRKKCTKYYIYFNYHQQLTQNPSIKR
jgi:hypothetical protein